MGGTALHACILAQWFEMLLLLLFKDALLCSSMGFYFVRYQLRDTILEP